MMSSPILTSMLVSLLACATGPSTTSSTGSDALPPTPSVAPQERVPTALRLIEQGQATAGVRLLAQAWNDASADERPAIEEAMKNAVDGGVPFADVRLLAEADARPGTFLDELVTMKLARVHLHLRDTTSAQAALAKYLERYPKGRYAKDALALEAQLGTRLQTDAKAVGVILPLTGDYAPYGRRALTAIELGFGITPKVDAPPSDTPQLDPATGEPIVVPKKKPKVGEGTETTPNGVKLIIKDSGGDPQKAAQAVKDLVEKDHVVAILGDILLDTSLPAALAAEEEGVPLLSLSRRDGVPEAGPWSFRLAMTARKQARALVDVAMDGMGMKRFAIMYPKHAFGVELMNEFWDALEARQAEVTAVESYDHDQTTFTGEAKQLVGRGMAGSSEVAACREEARAISNDYKKRKALEGCSDLAKPIVDFEALFIPDGFRAVSYIIPALVAEDVLVTRDRRTVETYRKTTGNMSVRPVQLFGVSMWNDPELARRLGKQIDGAVFVDGFDAGDGAPIVQKFVQGFASVHHGRPALVEAQAYDGAALLSTILLTASETASRDAIRQSLVDTKDFPGVTGPIRFDAQGDSTTPVRFFVVDDEQIEARDPAQLKGESG